MVLQTQPPLSAGNGFDVDIVVLVVRGRSGWNGSD